MSQLSPRSQSALSQSDNHPEQEIRCHVVGIGASAGGLEALERFFVNTPPETNASFVVVQHLSPDFRSHMDELLRRVTDIPIEVVKDGVEVAANTIYLIPPKTEMVISNGRLLLTERSTEKVLSHPIDQFFRSLARDLGQYSIGVVLSGTGADGSRGVQEIAAANGLVLAQDPASSKFDSMPLHAQETGDCHLVLPPEAMGEAIQRYIQDKESPAALRERQIGSLEEHGLSQVFRVLQKSQRIDFSVYKSGTVQRRIQRRIELKGLRNLDEYVDLLQQNSDEVSELYKDLLIGVTRFFRDAEAFEYLKSNVLPDQLRKSAERNEVFRVWVCGCASGEEAYSLAITIAETIEERGISVDFKLFATDAHRESLQYAATGIYPEEKMNDVSPSTRDRFFRKMDGAYHLRPELRRKVVFAPHNVISDPPFTQMDLISCRNLLIYLQAATQGKTLSLFHFALKLGGTLFLGPSETPGEVSDEFEPLQKQWRIYRKRRDVRLPLDVRGKMATAPLQLRGMPEKRLTESSNIGQNLLPAAYDALLSELMPPSLLIDSQFQILHVFPGCEAFLRYPTGRPTTNVLEIVYPDIRNSVAAAVQHALKDGTAVRYSGIQHPTEANQSISLHIKSLRLRHATSQCFLLQFESEVVSDVSNGTPVHSVELNADARLQIVEQELTDTRQNLQATIEELETSNEELQATNEEMVAANEELQSTNEELHSVNEELYTVNAEHQARVQELDQATSDMDNLLATTGVGVVFLDRDLLIRRFTPRIGELLYMEGNDIGRDFSGFSEKLNDPELPVRLRNVLALRKLNEWEVTTSSGTYLLRALPYWTGDSIAGIVVAFINIDTLKDTQAELAQFKCMADQHVDGFIIVDDGARVVYANPAAAKRLGYSVEEVQLLKVPKFDASHDMQDFHRVFDAARGKRDGLIFESVYRRSDGRTFPVEVAATFVELRGKPHLYCTVRDIRDRRRAERERRVLQNAVAAVENGIIICNAADEDLPITFANNGFYRMTGYDASEVLGRNCRFLQGEMTDADAIARIRTAIEAEEPCRVLVQNYRKDGSTFWNDVVITPVKDSEGVTTHFVGIQNDVSERIRIGESVRENERTIRLLLDSTAEGIIGVDADGFCTFCNQSAVRMLRFGSESDLIGRKILKCIQPTVEHGGLLGHSVREGQHVTNQDESFTTADGVEMPVQYWAHPICADETCIGAVITFVDDTERRKREQELRRARDEANAANQAKSHFLANMSHELRTPLAAILGFARIIEEEHGEPEIVEKLRTIQRNGDYLLRLLADILDLSRIESGKLDTAVEVVQLRDFIADLSHTMQIRAAESNAKLKFTAQGKLPLTISTDASRLRQILINVVANAIKFTSEGRVVVTFSHQSDIQNRLIVEVQDTGIGIAPEQLTKLFEPFTQADNTISKRFGGTGLGLSISRRLINSMGGTISCESVEGEGSIFRLEVPTGKCGNLTSMRLDDLKKRPVSSGADLYSSSFVSKLAARVLIVDDMRDVRFVAQHFLKKVGAEVDVAEDGAMAIQAVRTAIEKGSPYDLILMDVQMPVMSGPEAVKTLRGLNIQTPIIALTADAMKGTREKLVSDGFSDHLTKPLQVNLLLRMVQQLVPQND